MLITKREHLNSLLTALYEVSANYNLKINPKKSAVFAVKGHQKLNKGIDLRGIPVKSTYCYLGVTVDDCGSIEPHLDHIEKRSSYLRSNMSYYTRHLSFENQYLIWAVYIRPYLVYVAPLLET